MLPGSILNRSHTTAGIVSFKLMLLRWHSKGMTLFGLVHRAKPIRWPAYPREMGGKAYPDLVAATRDRLESTGLPFVIENTPGAPIRPDLVLCGSMFGLRLVRHRWFELHGIDFELIPPCSHHPDPVTVVGHGTPSWVRARRGGKQFLIQEKRDAMQIDWMNRGELAQAIPPAYSEWIGSRVLANITPIMGRDPVESISRDEL